MIIQNWQGFFHGLKRMAANTPEDQPGPEVTDLEGLYGYAGWALRRNYSQVPPVAGGLRRVSVFTTGEALAAGPPEFLRYFQSPAGRVELVTDLQAGRLDALLEKGERAWRRDVLTEQNEELVQMDAEFGSPDELGVLESLWKSEAPSPTAIGYYRFGPANVRAYRQGKNYHILTPSGFSVKMRVRTFEGLFQRAPAPATGCGTPGEECFKEAREPQTRA